MACDEDVRKRQEPGQHHPAMINHRGELVSFGKMAVGPTVPGIGITTVIADREGLNIDGNGL